MAAGDCVVVAFARRQKSLGHVLPSISANPLTEPPHTLARHTTTPLLTVFNALQPTRGFWEPQARQHELYNS